MPESIELARDVCEDLLRSGVAGRLALSTPDGPQIVPLNYSVVDDALIFRTSPYGVLGRFARGSVLAFEVDHIDYERHESWSVVARGRCAFIEDPHQIARIDAVWPPRPWAAGSRELFLRVIWTEISGRKLGLHWNPLDGLPVRRVVTGGQG